MAASSSKIRVGIVGANPQRGFASVAHIPALQALPDFEITAVCTTRQESAEAAARHLGARLAFADCEKLAQHPDVDLVTVSVKVPDHYRPVMAAIEEAVPADVLATALFARFRSRQDHTFGERLLSAMRFGFGGHLEEAARGG